MEKLGPGTYIATCMKAGLHKSDGGKLGVYVYFENEEGCAEKINWATESAWDMTEKALKNMGLSDDDMEDIAESIPKLVGSKNEIVIKDDEKYGLQIQWINSIGGNNSRINLVKDHSTKAQLTALVRAKRNGNSITSPLVSQPRSYVDPALQGDAEPFAPSDESQNFF